MWFSDDIIMLFETTHPLKWRQVQEFGPHFRNMIIFATKTVANIITTIYRMLYLYYLVSSCRQGEDDLTRRPHHILIAICRSPFYLVNGMHTSKGGNGHMQIVQIPLFQSTNDDVCSCSEFYHFK